MYQPSWIDGKEEGTSYRDCATRYKAIANHLRKESKFDVLDVGAHTGYFSLRLADEFDASVTAVDGHPGLMESLARAGDPRVRGVHRHLAGPDDLASLGSHRVGLCLSVLHHVSWWREMCDVMLELCDILFVEVPHPDEMVDGHPVSHPDIYPEVKALQGEVLCETPGNPSDSNPLRELFVIQ